MAGAAETSIVRYAPVSARGISEEQAGAIADLFKALADPNRSRVVTLLASSEAPVCVCEFTAPLGLSQPTVSFHLKKLVNAGLLRREQRGTWAHYSLDRSVLRAVAEVLTEGAADE